MAQFLNITGSRENNDPTFRYKMPKMVARTEGRGNGIRTLVVNMKEISEALNRPADLATKFFGIELGAQSRWESELEKSTVNGAHATPDLQKLLNAFIDRFVLCPKCHLPETALTVNVKKGLIYHKCSACGCKELVDMSHKLAAYILKQAELTIKTAELEAAAADLAAAKKKGAAAAAAGGAKAGAAAGGGGEGGVKKGAKKGGKGGAAGGEEEDEDDAAARAAVAPPAPPPPAAHEVSQPAPGPPPATRVPPGCSESRESSSE